MYGETNHELLAIDDIDPSANRLGIVRVIARFKYHPATVLQHMQKQRPRFVRIATCHYAILWGINFDDRRRGY